MVVISEIHSSSLSTLDHRYDVFLSFRGFDTRSSFTDHLYNTLVNANITTFLDDEEIETGLPLKPELDAAIRESRASIIVLSHNYASSTWCLDELVLILEQLSSPNYFVIPIFYHVEPTDVRKQQNNFGEAMAKHKQRMEADVEKRSQWAQKIDLWNKALTDVAGLKGEHITKGQKEVGFIEDIVTNIRRRLGVLLSTPQPLIIGREYDIKDITTWLNDGSSHRADIFTISGMAGIGKTTLAKYVYRSNCGEFQRSSFIEGINRTCAEHYNRLLDLQKQICGDLAHKKVFVVLDDVGSLDHLEALLGNKGFHPGSKVIITTQDASLTERYLLNLEFKAKHTKHLLGGLYYSESLELLSLSAFKGNNPKESYEDVSNKLVRYCEGHPLALEVLGKALRNKNVAEWVDYVERLVKKGPLSRIKKVFQMSLESLEEDEKELFLHIACFFVGKDRESTEIILKACEIHTVSGINNLVDRSLLSIDWDDTLMMHQLIQDTGRDIVHQESPNRPEKRSRLWYHKESFKVLKQKKGKGNVQGLVLDMRMLEEDKSYELDTDALSKMDNLKLLQLNYVQLKGSYENFPEELRWLCMHGFPLDHIPPGLQLEDLVCLDMSYSKLTCFDMSYGDMQRSREQKLTGLGSKHKPLLRSLKILNLSYCEQLGSLGGFSEFPALERLMLSNCISLIEVCESIKQCDGLEHIDLSYCNEAWKFSRTISKDNHLSNESFPMDMSSLVMLKDLCLDGNDIISMPDCVRTLPRLEKLSMGHCARLTTIEHPPRTLKDLIFYIWHEVGKVVFHEDMSPIKLTGSGGSFIEGLFKRVDMADVEEELLHSLGWMDLDLTKIQPVKGRSKVQVIYEFGIFSTFYRGKEIPNWIADRREGSSISFTVPSSPNNFIGLNFCYVMSMVRKGHSIGGVDMKISNETKKRTWIYQCPVFFEETQEGITHLSHWMFGKNEMGDGDQITLTIFRNNIMECGVELIYDDGKMKMEEGEKDALSYYKSWNHIIGGDLSPFQTSTPGEYFIRGWQLLGFGDDRRNAGIDPMDIDGSYSNTYSFSIQRLTVTFQASHRNINFSSEPNPTLKLPF
ncbi:hypothetical protein OSB04_013308 [Centaurea solstitialis]|uniref:ADP-ribosyl cyclase/cyclic ADP-ribose hydrolase n=1 Tax=Centaurea solstitialis TaxID=347529 RepID=A0AA38WQJ2_9ASTR|nr:hypothetical protein OSB04_013308 [Centaurea solstitialis]